MDGEESVRNSTMGIYDNQVKNSLGPSVWAILEKCISHGWLDAKKMKDTAQMLDPRVGGGHLRRTQGGSEPDWFEFREVLSDWYQQKPQQFDSDTQDAVETLIDIFECPEISLKPVAKELKVHCPPRQHPHAKEIETDRAGTQEHRCTHQVWKILFLAAFASNCNH